MSFALSLPSIPAPSSLPAREVDLPLSASTEELRRVEQNLQESGQNTQAFEAICDFFYAVQGTMFATAMSDVARDFWRALCELVARDQRDLAAVRQWPRGRARRVYLKGIAEQTARLAEIMRTMDVMWEELELETPDEIYEAVWTIRIPLVARLRAMWNLFWSAIRHPLSETTIDLSTGRVLYRESSGGASPLADPKPDEPTPAAPKPRRRRAIPVVTANRFDVLVLLVLSAALFLAMILFTVLAAVSKDTAISGKLADALAYICMLSIGAIGGRLTGKTGTPDRIEASDE